MITVEKITRPDTAIAAILAWGLVVFIGWLKDVDYTFVEYLTLYLLVFISFRISYSRKR